MGLNNENAVVGARPWIAFDIETAPLVNAGDYIDPPNLDDIEAPANYKDPEKIAAFVADAKVKKAEKYARDCAEKAGLDWNVGRVVCVGLQTEAMTEPQVSVAETEKREREVLFWLWETISARRPVCGFRIRTFDLPFCIQRSRFLGVMPPRLSLARFDNRELADLFDILTFSDTQDTKVMRHSLKSFGKRFGIPCDDNTDGKDIAAMVAADDWDGIANHCASDVQLTVELAKRLGVITRFPVEVAV